MLGILLLAVPLFLLMARPDAGSVLLGQCGFALLIAAYSGTVPATLVEMFCTRTRCTALAISYNTAFAILGGTAPMVAVYLVSREHGGSRARLLSHGGGRDFPRRTDDDPRPDG